MNKKFISSCASGCEKDVLDCIKDGRISDTLLETGLNVAMKMKRNNIVEIIYMHLITVTYNEAKLNTKSLALDSKNNGIKQSIGSVIGYIIKIRSLDMLQNFVQFYTSFVCNSCVFNGNFSALMTCISDQGLLDLISEEDKDEILNICFNYKLRSTNEMELAIFKSMLKNNMDKCIKMVIASLNFDKLLYFWTRDAAAISKSRHEDFNTYGFLGNGLSQEFDTSIMRLVIPYYPKLLKFEELIGDDLCNRYWYRNNKTFKTFLIDFNNYIINEDVVNSSVEVVLRDYLLGDLIKIIVDYKIDLIV